MIEHSEHSTLKTGFLTMTMHVLTLQEFLARNCKTLIPHPPYSPHLTPCFLNLS